MLIKCNGLGQVIVRDNFTKHCVRFTEELNVLTLGKFRDADEGPFVRKHGEQQFTKILRERINGALTSFVWSSYFQHTHH